MSKKAKKDLVSLFDNIADIKQNTLRELKTFLNEMIDRVANLSEMADNMAYNHLLKDDEHGEESKKGSKKR